MPKGFISNLKIHRNTKSANICCHKHTAESHKVLFGVCRGPVCGLGKKTPNLISHQESSHCPFYCREKVCSALILGCACITFEFVKVLALTF